MKNDIHHYKKKIKGKDIILINKLELNKTV